MPKNKDTLTNKILAFLEETANYLPAPFETPYSYIKRAGSLSPRGYYHAVYQLKKRGALQFLERRGKRFVKLTRKGKMDLLLSKAKIAAPRRWDGKWRMVLFDIPEVARSERDRLRTLLKANKFIQLQNSVYVSPFPLNQSAIEYLKEIKLLDYIRIARVDEFDQDKDLILKFKTLVLKTHDREFLESFGG